MMRLPSFAIATALAVTAGVAISFFEARAGEVSVVELYTSQGCSSCPPADRLMGELAKRDDIVALSLPVDYWDYIGWKDTLASPENSLRQRAYARELGLSHVYTPQMVVNGADHAVGSHPTEVEAAIRRSSVALGEDRVDVRLSEGNGTIIVDIAGGERAGPATVWLVLYKGAESVAIGRGENAGRTITYYNVVREMTPIGMWKGVPESITLPKADLARAGLDGCAVLVQRGGNGAILGAAAMNQLHLAGK